jgi:uncharacterized membrane protein YkvA (DUF1232 family)
MSPRPQTAARRRNARRTHARTGRRAARLAAAKGQPASSKHHARALAKKARAALAAAGYVIVPVGLILPTFLI